MKEYIKRMVDEAKELEDKIWKARDFVNSELGNNILDDNQKKLLRTQIQKMQEYLDVLEIRIEYDKMK